MQESQSSKLTVLSCCSADEHLIVEAVYRLKNDVKKSACCLIKHVHHANIGSVSCCASQAKGVLVMKLCQRLHLGVCSWSCNCLLIASYQ